MARRALLKPVYRMDCDAYHIVSVMSGLAFFS
jgi:hypothetical protein